MTKSDQFIKSRIIWRAERANAPSETIQLFENLNENQKNNLAPFIGSNQLGLPVLFFEGEDNTCTILCTKGAVGLINNQLEYMAYKNVKSHTVGDLPFIEDDMEDDDDDFDKLAQHKILLKDVNNIIVELHAKQNGKDVFTLYNLLIMLFRMEGVENYP